MRVCIALKENGCLHIRVFQNLFRNFTQELIADNQRAFAVIEIKSIIRLFVGNIFFCEKPFKIVDPRGLAIVIIVFVIGCCVIYTRRVVQRRICVFRKEGIIGFRINIHLVCRDIEGRLELSELKYVPVGVVFVCNMNIDHVIGKFFQVVDRSCSTEAVFRKETFRR